MNNRFARLVRSFGIAAASAALVLFALPDPAHAAWSAVATGSGEAVAAVMPAGHTPAGSASGSSVTVTWSVSRFSSGAAVEGYAIARYDATTHTAASVNASCSGEITALSCVENAVPPGHWQYTVAPVQGGWHGVESAPSPVVVVS